MSLRSSDTGESGPRGERVTRVLALGPACPARMGIAGFTLVEMLVVMALIALIMSLAAPSFERLSKAASISSAVDQFMTDMRFARSEAIRRGGGVVLCRSDDPESPAPDCAVAPSSQGWASGWILFHDLDGNGLRGADEDLLRVQAPLGRVGTISSGGTPTTFRFSATGRLLTPGSFSTLQFGSDALPEDIRRIVCVAPGGRARIAGDGSASCGAQG